VECCVARFRGPTVRPGGTALPALGSFLLHAVPPGFHAPAEELLLDLEPAQRGRQWLPPARVAIAEARQVVVPRDITGLLLALALVARQHHLGRFRALPDRALSA